MNDSIESGGGFQENLLEIDEEINHNQENMIIKRGFFLKIFLILIIQYVLIILLSIIFAFYINLMKF